MKKLVSLLLVLMMVFTVSMAMAETVTVAPGDSLSFDVEISGASGRGARIGLDLGSEDNEAPVTFDKAEGGSVNDTVPPKAFNDFFVVVNLDGIDLLPDGSDWSDDLMTKYAVQNLANGHIGTVYFTVDAEAAEGTYTVSAVKEEGTCTVTGSITFEVKKPVVSDRIPGDADDNGFVEWADLIEMLKFVSEWGNEINESNADVNEDNAVSWDDMILILKYISGWDVELK